MKKLTSAILGLLLLGAMRPPVVKADEVTWFGRISLLGGAEAESAKRKDAFAGDAHGLIIPEALAIIPVTPNLGIQLLASYQGGDGSNRIGLQAGPIVGWSGGIGSGGKAGFFFTDQYRAYPPKDVSNRQGNFFWLRPAVSLYDLFPKTNIDFWWSQPISRQLNNMEGKFGDCCPQHLIPYSQVRLAANWFPAGIPWTTRDNVELTLGIQMNGYTGIGSNNVQPGVGPVFGAAVMPWQNVEVQLVKVAIDNHNRYRLTTGLQYYFDKTNSTLLQLRRKYLEPTNLPGSVTSWHSF